MLENLGPFFKRTLEKASENKYNNEFESTRYCTEIQNFCDENICAKINNKIEKFISAYTEISWEPNEVPKGHLDVIEDVTNYLMVF